MKFLSVGQEVEAKFNTSGFRGAWFLCRVGSFEFYYNQGLFQSYLYCSIFELLFY